MRFLPKLVLSSTRSEESAPDVSSAFLSEEGAELSGWLKTFGWVSAALGAVAVGLVVGRELRQRYKFNRRTPYDLYAHAGDEFPDVEFGVGV